MAFLRRISGTFSSQPITLHMIPAEERVMLDFRRGDELLEYDTVINDPTGKRLPAKVLEFLSNNVGKSNGYYPIPYPYAMQMLRGLRKQGIDDLLFDCASIEQLRVIARPSNFELLWHYSPDHHALVRRLVGADNHLGKCWFQRADTVWKLADELPDTVQKWLCQTKLNDRYVFRFVTEIMPICTRLNYPVACDLFVIDGVTFKFKWRSTRKSLLQFSLESNRRELESSLSLLQGDDRNLISGDVILPNLRDGLSDRLIESVRAGEATLMGEQIPAFIQDELRPHARQLDVDMSEIDKLYPVILAEQVKPAWELEQAEIRGVGVYWAISNINYAGTTTSLIELQALAADHRFYNFGDVWVEFTPAFRERLASVVKNGATAFALTPSELLGVSSERLQRFKLTPPALPEIRIDLAQSISEPREQVYTRLAVLRKSGLPAGISGLQLERQRLLVDLCLSLQKEYPNFNVLWVVSKKRKDSTQQTLHDLRKTTLKPPHDSLISVVSPDQLNQQIADTEWALVIFQDLDQIVPSQNFARAYQLIRRLWAVATFDNRQWHENLSLQEKVLQALRLTHENAPAFLTTCHLDFPDQQETVITRIASPFKRILLDSSEDVRAAPVPARPTISQPPVTPSKVEPDHRPPLPFDGITATSSGDRFVQEARVCLNYVVQPAEPVPFMQYYPTYSSMSPAQLRWYLYWRDQLRRGNAISTDLSYLFVHIYECLNLVGFDSAQSAFDHLVSLWTQYRALQPKLDRYLVDWLADFIIVHRLQINPLDWYARALLADWHSGGDLEFGFSAWLSGRDYTQFPLELIYHLIQYNPTKNKFYRESRDTVAINSALVQGIKAVDEYLLFIEKRGLFEQDAPPVVEVVSRPPFAGALHRYSNAPIRIAEVHRWSQATDLAGDLTGILKYVENILRDQANFGSKLRGITIPHAWKVVLDQAFGVEEPPPAVPAKRRGRPRKSQPIATETSGERVAPSIEMDNIPEAPEHHEIVIDANALARLAQETEEIHARLLEDGESEQRSENPQPVVEPETPIAAASPSLPSSYTERPPDAPPGLLTDLPEVAVAMGASDDIGAKLLRLLRKNNWQAEPALLETIIESGFLSLHLDSINERAFEQFNDALIFQEGNLWVVAEDYRDEIGYILDHPSYEASGAEQPPPNVEAQPPAYAELSEDWALFAQQLQPHHWEAIAALLSHADVAVRLDAIARSAYTTGNLLVDAINDAAMDTIGDIVIDTLPDPPRIEDEDFDALTQMLTWANANQLLEL